VKDYLFIDTNIFVQICIQEKEGDTIKDLKKISQLLEEKKITLLMPEVVELEINAQVDKKFSQIDRDLGSIREHISNSSLNRKIKKDIGDKIGDVVRERKDNSIDVKENINLILGNSQTIKIPMTFNHMVDSYKRFLLNIKPYKNGQNGEIQPDCMIIEALQDYLNNKNSQYKLYICTQNADDFCDSKKKKTVISSDILESFNGEILCYVNLYELLNDKFGADFSNERVSALKEALNNAKIAESVLSSIDIAEAVSRANEKMSNIISTHATKTSVESIKNLSNQLQRSTQSQLSQIAKFANIEADVLESYRNVLQETAERLEEAYALQFMNKTDTNSNKEQNK